jgi:3-oxoacyl-[acyl-carrier-protein] synthase II
MSERQSDCKVVVTGIGLVSALGTSLETSWQRLLRGETGIRCHSLFPELGDRPLGLVADTPHQLSDLTSQAVYAALADAGLSTPLPDCGVVIGSSRGCQGIWENFTRSPLQPSTLQNWLQTLPAQASVTAARILETQGPVLSPMAACATGNWAIARGLELIRTGECQRVLVGAAEAPITPLTLAGFRQMGALATTGAYPFDLNRQGFVLAEGAAVLVVETEAAAQARQAKIYGQILGFGLTADAEHRNAPGDSMEAAIAAIEQCLQRSDLTPEAIDYIHAHGTATRLNDQFEAALIQHCFPKFVAVSSTKGATGHTLGASGALGTAFALMALKNQVLPPCVGLNQTDFDLNLLRSAQLGNFQTALCLSFGFGGQNTAIAVAQY